METNEEQARYWNERAPEWVSFERVFEHVGGPMGELAIERLAPAPGMRVLDIGCGTGGTTVALADRVAPGGRVVGADISAPLLDEARARAGDRDDVAFLVADAQADDLGEGGFDAAFSRFGVMFFADPVAAFANIRRSVAPGGRLSFVSWQPPFVNEWLLVPTMAAITVLGIMPEMPEPGAPGPFGLSDPELVRRILDESGWTGVDITPHNDTVSFPPEQISALAEAGTGSVVVRELLAQAGEERSAEVATGIEAALAERVADGVLSLSRAVLVVTASA